MGAIKNNIIMYMKDDLLGYIIILFVLLIAYKMYKESDFFNLTCVVSTIDGEKYCVRERKNVKNASDLLAKTTIKMTKLVQHLKHKYTDNDVVDRLVSRFNPKKIVEILPNSEYTAYSENKGRKIALCLNVDKKQNDNLIDENTLMFVALHEMSHIGTKSVGHGDDFWNNFKFLIKEATECNVYVLEDYAKSPKEYCSMSIKDNPYYDL